MGHRTKHYQVTIDFDFDERVHIQNKLYLTKRSRTKFFYSRTFAYEYAAIRKRENTNNKKQ